MGGKMQKTMSLLLKKRDQKGFTLIELLVVIAIVGTLMAIGVSNYLTYKTKGADAAAHAAAADFLTLSMAWVADTGAKTGVHPAGTGAAGPVPGYVLAPNVTIAGTAAGINIDAAGVIANSVTFTGTGGTKTFIVDNTGTVHE